MMITTYKNKEECQKAYPDQTKVSFEYQGIKGDGLVVGVWPSRSDYRNFDILIKIISIYWGEQMSYKYSVISIPLETKNGLGHLEKLNVIKTI